MTNIIDYNKLKNKYDSNKKNIIDKSITISEMISNFFQVIIYYFLRYGLFGFFWLSNLFVYSMIFGICKLIDMINNRGK